MKTYRKEQDKYVLRRRSEKEGCDGLLMSQEWISTHSETNTALGSCGIQENTWQAKDELERCGKEGRPKNGINLGRVETSAQDRHSWRQRVALCIGDAG